MEAWALMGARERAVETEQGRDGKWDWKSVESLRILCRGGSYLSGFQQKTDGKHSNGITNGEMIYDG